MGTRELEALLHQTLNDPRIAPATRASIERVFHQRAMDPDTVTLFCAQAIVLAPGGLFGVDLVPDVPNWREYSNQIQMKGKAQGGAHLTLVESVRQDRTKHLTIFEQTYIERRGEQVRKPRPSPPANEPPNTPVSAAIC